MSSWELTEEQELLKESVQEFCARNVSEAKVKEWYAAKRVDDDFFKAYLDAGFAWMGIQEEHGGIPADMLTRCVLVEEMARGCGVALPTTTNTIIMYDICELGTPEQSSSFLENYKKTGQANLCLGISEPCAGSDNAAMASTTTAIGDGKYILRGSKTFSSNARNADYLMVVAKDEDPARSNKSMSLWLVPKETPGITVVDVDELAYNLCPFSDVYFDDVELDESQLLGVKGEGLLNLMKNLEIERMIAVAGTLGLAQAAMDDAAAYASERIVFEQPIGNFQLVQLKLVEMEVRLQNMRNLLYKTAYEIDQGKSGRLSTALLKYYASQAAREVCHDAMQIFGGIGYTTETRVGRLWLETRGNEFGGGTGEIMVYIAGRQLLKKYKR